MCQQLVQICTRLLLCIRLGGGVIIDSLPSFFLKVISRGSRCIFTADMNCQGRARRRGGGLCRRGGPNVLLRHRTQTAQLEHGRSAGAAAGLTTGPGFTAQRSQRRASHRSTGDKRWRRSQATVSRPTGCRGCMERRRALLRAWLERNPAAGGAAAAWGEAGKSWPGFAWAKPNELSHLTIETKDCRHFGYAFRPSGGTKPVNLVNAVKHSRPARLA